MRAVVGGSLLVVMGNLSHTVSRGQHGDGGEMLTVAQASLRLGKSVMTVHRMIARGSLPVAHRLAGKTGAYLVWAADVNRLARNEAA